MDEILQSQLTSKYFPYVLQNGKLVSNLLYGLIYADNTLAKIKKYINATQILPDYICLDIALAKLSHIKGLKELIEFIIEQGKLKIDRVIARKYLTKCGDIALLLFDKLPINEIIKPEKKYITTNDIVNVIDKQITNKKYNIIQIESKNNIQINYKNKIKQKINDNATNIFKLKNNILSLMELKKCIINYIKSNKLLVDNLIIIDDNLSKLLNIKINDAVQFINFDIILTYCL